MNSTTFIDPDQEVNRPTHFANIVMVCRALNGIGQRQYESPILKSAAKEN
jgi:hypothetical protein